MKTPAIKERFFTVYIIESPSAGDLFHKKSEGEILERTLKMGGIPSEYKIVANANYLNVAITTGLIQYLENKKALPPAVHISAHGNQDGFELTSGELIEWEKLKEILKPINQALSGNLLLCMSSCEGFSAIKTAMNEEDGLPFFEVVGPSGEPYWSDSAIAFAAFYHHLAKGSSISDAVQAMRHASGYQGFAAVRGETAKRIFSETMKKIEAEDIARRLQNNLAKK